MNPYSTSNIIHNHMGYVAVDRLHSGRFTNFSMQFFPSWGSKYYFRPQKSSWADTTVSRAKPRKQSWHQTSFPHPDPLTSRPSASACSPRVSSQPPSIGLV